MVSKSTRFPLTRYALARLLVLLAYRVLPDEAAWDCARLWAVNDSIKKRTKAILEAEHDSQPGS